MPGIALAPPISPSEPITELLHGVSVTDPYRWLEDQDSPRTRQWIWEQTQYARDYLDNLPGRQKIRERIREFLAVETHNSLQKAGNRYFFRKRLADQEQPCICMRAGADGEDQLLVDPAEHGAGKYTAVKPLRVSPDGRLLLFEVKEGGERTGTFKLLEIESRRTLPDVLPRGYLRGFAFAPDGKEFCYVHEPANGKKLYRHVAFRHVLGDEFSEDREIFFGGEGEKLRLCLISDATRIGFLRYRFLDKTRTDFLLQPWESKTAPEHILRDADYSFGPMLVRGRILAITDRDAPNLRIVELRLRPGIEPEWIDLIPGSDSRILQWAIAGDRILTLTARGMDRHIRIFDLTGRKTEEITVNPEETFRITGAAPESDEVFLERESFTDPIRIVRYSPERKECALWAKKTAPAVPPDVSHTQTSYPSKDGTRIPIYLVGRRQVLAGGCHPAIMTSYGGFGVSMTPQFSVFVAFLIEKGCLFALPNIRGGSEFGTTWHNAAKRRNRQTAYDDFLSAAEWLIQAGRTTAARLAIFGGSNSGLLVGAAMTQRPDLFRAVVCMVPMLDMLRYHLFDDAHVWRDEFGTADDPDDFDALRRYSPYHQVRNGVPYPATMIVSGDADKNCNPLHARKMTARLQAATSSGLPVFLDYSRFRGHSPVLPLDEALRSIVSRREEVSEEVLQPTLISGLVPRKKQRIQGVVVSARMNKTIVVMNERKVKHPLYKRVMSISKKFYAHDESNCAKEGDFVAILESRPISKMKHWRLEAIIRRKEMSSKVPEWLRIPPLIKLSMPHLTGNLHHDRTYEVQVRVQGKQYKLVDERHEVMEDSPQTSSVERNLTRIPNTANPRSQTVELVVKLSGFTLRPAPSIVFVKSSREGPVVDPASFTICPKEAGRHFLFVSVLRRSSSELIQSQTFEFDVE